MGYFLMKMNLAIVLGVAVYGVYRFKKHVDTILSKSMEHMKDDDGWDDL